MNFVIDIIFIVILGVICFGAVKKGFIKTVLEFAFSLLGTAASWVIAKTFTQTIYSTYVKSKLISYVDEKLLAGASASVSNNVNTLLAQIPEPILALGRQLGIIGENFEVNFSGMISASQLESSLFGPIAAFIVKCILFIVASVVLGIILHFVASAIDRVVKKSSLKSLNAVLSGVFGILKGTLIVLIVSLILVAISSAMPNSQFAALVADSKICSLAVEILNMI